MSLTAPPRLVAAIASLLLACSCSGPRAWLSEADASDGDADLVAAAGREFPKSWELRADRALADERRVLLRYQAGERVVYSAATWSAASRGASASARALLAPLGYHRATPWPEDVAGFAPVSVLPVRRWIDLRGELLASIVPREPDTGVVLTLADEELFVEYVDDRIVSTALVQKAPQKQIRASLGFQEMAARTLELLGADLEQRGSAVRRLLFDSGDWGPGSLPFVYADLDARTLVFLEFEAEAPPRAGTSALRGIDAATHLTRSFSWGLATRPATSLSRLLFLVTDAGVDAARPEWVRPRGDPSTPPLATGPGMDLAAFETRLDALTGRPASRGELRTLVDGKEYFPRLIESLLAAQHGIRMRTYIFDDDDYALQIADLLKQRSLDGIEVEVLLDGLGSLLATSADAQGLPGSHVAPASVREYLGRDSKVQVRQSVNPWLTGDHVKTTIVDDRTAFLGGMNIGREYRYDWHDLMLEVSGPVVDELRESFEASWAHAGAFGDLGLALEQLAPATHRAGDGGEPVRVLHTSAEASEIYAAQLEAIRWARRYIYIENAYFSDDTVLHELVNARRRGVDVRVILPLRGNHGTLNKSNALAANHLLENGVRVFIYPGMSHLKAAVYDGWACVGSANFDKLSLRLNRELNLATSAVAPVEELLERVFRPDFERSPELTEPFRSDLSDHLAEIVSDFLL